MAGVRGKLDDDGNVTDADTQAALRKVLKTLMAEVRSAKERVTRTSPSNDEATSPRTL